MKKRIILCVAISFLAILLILLSFFYADGYLVGGNFSYLITFIIELVLLFWGLSIAYRVQYKSQRAIVLTISILIFIWLLVRFVKWLPNIHFLSIYLDYFYYAVILAIPVLFVALVGETLYYNDKRKKVLYIIISSISLILLLFILTNNLHHLMYKDYEFSYAPDNPKLEIIKYSYGPLHYVAMIFILLTSLLAFVLLLIKVKKQFSLKELIYPLIIIFITITYSAMYLFKVSFIRNTLFLKDLALMISIMITTLLESFLYIGLIQNNGRYLFNFKNSSLKLCILNEDDKILYESNNYNHEYYQTQDINYRFIKKKIGNYSLIVEEDMEEINSLKNKINEDNTNLKKINDILEKTLTLNKNNPSKDYLINLSNEIDLSIKNTNDEINNLVNNLPDFINQNSETKVRQDLGLIALLLGYMKQKCMLMLEIKERDNLSKEALSMLLNVTTHDILNAGFKDAAYTITGDKDINISFVILLNEFINKVAYNYRFQDAYLFIKINTNLNKVVLEIDTNTKSIIDIAIPNVKIDTNITDTVNFIMEVR